MLCIWASINFVFIYKKRKEAYLLPFFYTFSTTSNPILATVVRTASSEISPVR